MKHIVPIVLVLSLGATLGHIASVVMDSGIVYKHCSAKVKFVSATHFVDCTDRKIKIK